MCHHNPVAYSGQLALFGGVVEHFTAVGRPIFGLSIVNAQCTAMFGCDPDHVVMVCAICFWDRLIGKKGTPADGLQCLLLGILSIFQCLVPLCTALLFL
jgi:hypothetical protein